MWRCSSSIATVRFLVAPGTDMSRRFRILILGGTADAVALAAEAEARFADRLTVITSLAGRTSNPIRPAGEVRHGGFGGSEGLAAYLRAAAIDAVVDATHPFACQISAHAMQACDAKGIPRLVLLRPPWTERPGDRWHSVADGAAAARLVPQLGRRAFLTVGARDLGAFAPVRGVWFLVRLVETPLAPLPLGEHELLVARGPFDCESEVALLTRHQIDLVVSKASGGRSTEGKIEAARQLGLPVIMVRRPDPVPGMAVESVQSALSWIEECLAALDLPPAAAT